MRFSLLNGRIRPRLMSLGYRQVLAVTYYNPVIVTENHLPFVTGRHIA